MKIAHIEDLRLRWDPKDPPTAGSAFLRVWTDDGLCGLGEASPMQGGIASLGILTRDIAPAVIGADPLDHAVIQDKLLHRLVKLGPEGALSGALAALDIALWDLKGKYLNQPVYKLLGGAWRTALPFYSSIGGNGTRTVDEVLRVVEQRLRDKPAAIKIRFDNDRSTVDIDIAGDLAKARAVRKLVGPDFPLAFDANNGFSLSGAMRVGRALEELGYWWFEEPVQQYHVTAVRRLARQAGHYRLRRRADLHACGARRPDRCRGADRAAGHHQDGRHHRPAALRRARPSPPRRAGAAPNSADHRSSSQHASRRAQLHVTNPAS